MGRNVYYHVEVKYLRLKAGGLSLTVTSGDDRHLDIVPTSHTRGTASKIICSIEVGIGFIATLFTGEFTLTDTVAFSDIAATGAPLRGIACINKLHIHTLLGSFVGDKTLQLSKTPIAHSSTLFAASLDTFTDVCQVLHCQGISWLARGNNLFGDLVIAISLKSFQSASQLFQVALGRFCTFSLKLSSQTEVAVIRFFDLFTAKELRVRSNGKAVDAQINTDHLPSWFNQGNSARNDHVQPVSTLAVHQISTFLLPFGCQVLLIVSWDFHGNKGTIVCTSFLLHMDKRCHTSVPVKAEGTSIIADSTQLRVGRPSQFERLDRFSCLLSFLQSLLIGLYLLFTQSNHAFNSLGGLDTGSTHQLRGKMGRSTMVRIGQLMQLHPITDLFSIGKVAHLIEASGVLLHRLLQEVSLLRSGLQLDAYRTCLYHVHIVAQCRTDVKYWEGGAAFLRA